MDIIVPVPITDSVLLSSNVVENDAPTWSSGATYAAGALVIYNHIVYESLQAANSDKQPDLNPTWWLKLRATNRYMMFDNYVSSKTEQAGDINVTLKPGIVTSLAMLGLQSSSVTVTMTTPALGTFYTRTIDLQRPAAKQYHGYFFERRKYRTTLFLGDLPSIYEATINITINPDTTGVAKCGLCVVGYATFVGEFNYGAGGEMVDFTTVKTDEFGETSITPRASARKLNGEVWLNPNDIDDAVDFMDSIKGVPVFVNGADQFDSARIFGVRKEFSFAYAEYSHAIYNIRFDGFI